MQIILCVKIVHKIQLLLCLVVFVKRMQLKSLEFLITKMDAFSVKKTKQTTKKTIFVKNALIVSVLNQINSKKI